MKDQKLNTTSWPVFLLPLQVVKSMPNIITNHAIISRSITTCQVACNTNHLTHDKPKNLVVVIQIANVS